MISNNADAYALTRAANAGVPGICVSPKDFPTRADFNDALLAKIDEIAPDLIVLAGFLVQVPEAMVRAYPGKIINNRLPSADKSVYKCRFPYVWSSYYRYYWSSFHKKSLA